MRMESSVRLMYVVELTTSPNELAIIKLNNYRKLCNTIYTQPEKIVINLT